MCTGRIDLSHLFRAFEKGADGVIIVGCRLNECNYTTHGNFAALNKVSLAKSILKHLGINPDRLRIEFMSSGDGVLFARTMNDFVESVLIMGRTGEGEGIAADQLDSRIKQVTGLLPYIKVVEKEKLARRFAEPREYAGLYGDAEIAALVDRAASYEIDQGDCRACMICLRRCPAEAIVGGKGQKHSIDQAKCIRCGTCFEVCPSRFSAVKKIV